MSETNEVVIHALPPGMPPLMLRADRPIRPDVVAYIREMLPKTLRNREIPIIDGFEIYQLIDGKWQALAPERGGD